MASSTLVERASRLFIPLAAAVEPWGQLAQSPLPGSASCPPPSSADA